MRPEFLLTVRGEQRYADREPEVIELTTEAELTGEGGVLRLSYRETELTGLQGTKTVFELYPHRVVLRRTGTVRSEMEFVVGKTHHSLYDTGEGALMITIRTILIEDRMTLEGGTLRVAYTISVEGLGSGTIEYKLHVRRRPG